MVNTPTNVVDFKNYHNNPQRIRNEMTESLYGYQIALGMGDIGSAKKFYAKGEELVQKWLKVATIANDNKPKHLRKPFVEPEFDTDKLAKLLKQLRNLIEKGTISDA